MSESIMGDMNKEILALSKRIRELQESPARKQHIAAQRAELLALPDEHWGELQHKMATDKRQRPPCTECQELSYNCVASAFAFHKLLKCWGCEYIEHVQAFAASFSLIEMCDGGGYVTPCTTCVAKGPLTFEWIAEIPFAKFREWQIDHPSAYVIDDMRELVPPKQFADNDPRKYNFPIQRALENGQGEYGNPDAFELRVPVTAKPEPASGVFNEKTLTQKPGGGFEFL